MKQETNQALLNFLSKALDENIKTAQNLLIIKMILEEHRSDFDNAYREIIEKMNIDGQNFKEDIISLRQQITDGFSGLKISKEERQKETLALARIDKFMAKFSKKGYLLKLITGFMASLGVLIGSAVGAIELFKKFSSATQDNTRPPAISTPQH